jgi:hypothetical protein
VPRAPPQTSVVPSGPFALQNDPQQANNTATAATTVTG